LNKWLPAIAFSVLLLVPVGAHDAFGAYNTFTGNAGGFVTDTATPQFLTAIGGGPDDFISFSVDKFGNTITVALGPVDGTIYSDNVIFTSPLSGTPNMVRHAGDGTISSEIGPEPSFSGILRIDFLSAGNTASAVGFGPVAFATSNEVIRIYDENNVLVLTISPPPAFTFSFVGVVGTNGDRIGSIELDGGGFAIQDIQFDFSSVLVGGELIPIDTTALILAGTQTFSWMIPVLLSGVGIGLFVVSRKSK